MIHFTPKTFELLVELTENNHRDWYTQNKEAIEQFVRKPFAGVLAAATQQLAFTRVPLRGGAETLFRQNRDVRFAKDKSPYNTHVSGLLTPSGSKSEEEGVLFLQLDIAGGLIACGFYKPNPERLGCIRERILVESEAFARVLQDLALASLTLRDDDMLVKMPRQYAGYTDHPHALHLKRKNLIAQASLCREAWLDGSIVRRVVEVAKSCESLLTFGQSSGWPNQESSP